SLARSPHPRTWVLVVEAIASAWRPVKTGRFFLPFLMHCRARIPTVNVLTSIIRALFQQNCGPPGQLMTLSRLTLLRARRQDGSTFADANWLRDAAQRGWKPMSDNAVVIPMTTKKASPEAPKGPPPKDLYELGEIPPLGHVP